MNTTIARRVRRLGASALAIGAIVALSACGGIEAPGSTADAAACERSTDKTIGIDFPLNQLSVFNNLKSFAEERAAERGYELQFTADNGDIQRQTDQIQTWVTKQIPAITTYALEPSSMEPLAQEAMGNCTVVVSYAGQLTNEDGFITLSSKESGELLGKEAVAWATAQNRPIKALILNDRDLDSGALRDDGLQAEFPGSADNVTVIGTQKAGSREEGEEVTRTVLQANPDLDMVVAYNDDSAIGAYQAFVNAGVPADSPDVFIGGQDGSEEGLKLVKEGGIFRTTIALRIRDVGYAMVDVPADILEGKDADSSSLNMPLVPMTVDHKDIDEYVSDYAAG